MPESPAPQNAQRVMQLLTDGKIPNSVLVRLIAKYGGGDPIISYWDGFTSKGEELVRIVGNCYRDQLHFPEVVGTVCPHARRLVFQGFVWSEAYGVRIGEPIMHGIDGASQFIKSGRVERLDAVLDRLLPEVDPTVAKLDAFDPWHPSTPSNGHTIQPWFAVPRDLNHPDRTFLFNEQREILAAIMRWIASYARVAVEEKTEERKHKDDRIGELAHLIELIAVYHNFLWGFCLSAESSKPVELMPIIFAQRGSTLPTGVSSATVAQHTYCE